MPTTRRGRLLKKKKLEEEQAVAISATAKKIEEDEDEDDDSGIDTDEEEDDDDHTINQKQLYMFDGVQYDNYQEMVNAKRKRNQDVLLGLGLLDTTNKPNAISKNTAVAASKRGIKKQKMSPQPINTSSSRKSSRIAGTKVNHVALDYNVQNWNADNTTVVKMNTNTENDDDDDDASVNKPRYFKGRLTDKAEITIEDAISFNDNKWISDDSIDNAHNFFKELSSSSSCNNSNTKSTTTIDETATLLSSSSWSSSSCNKNKNKKDDDDSTTAKIRSMVDNLSIDNEEWVAKVTPDRIYSVTTHPNNNKLLACAGDKQGYVGLWDVNNQYHQSSQNSSTTTNNQSNNNGVHLFHIHSRPVCCMEWISSHQMITASYDGTIRKLNIETQTFEEIFATYDADDSYFAEELGYGLDEGYKYWIQHVSVDHRFSSHGQCLFASTSTGKAIHIDLRVSSKGKQHITFNESLSEKKINTLSLHPNGNTLASGGLDGIVRLWDIRKFGSSSTRKSPSQTNKKSPKPVAYQSVGLSISSSYFSPSGNSLLTTSFTNKLDITENAHLSNKGEMQKKPTYSIRHNNQTGRWLSTFMATWHPKHDIFVCGSMSKPRCMEVYDSKGNLLRQISGDSMTAVASRCCYHPSIDRLIMIGGNSSGRVVAVQ